MVVGASRIATAMVKAEPSRAEPVELSRAEPVELRVVEPSRTEPVELRVVGHRNFRRNLV